MSLFDVKNSIVLADRLYSLFFSATTCAHACYNLLDFHLQFTENLKVSYLWNNICSMVNGYAYTTHSGLKTGLRSVDKMKFSLFWKVQLAQPPLRSARDNNLRSPPFETGALKEFSRLETLRFKCTQWFWINWIWLHSRNTEVFPTAILWIFSCFYKHGECRLIRI